jgi:hypothetical protein
VNPAKGTYFALLKINYCISFWCRKTNTLRPNVPA